MDSVVVANVERGCGRRKKGGLYIETGLSNHGSPVEEFLIDQTMPVDPGSFPTQGMQILQDRSGTYHLLDYVGAEHYPNVWDFVGEVARYGLSRRVPRTVDFSLLSRESRIILIHKRAFVANRDMMPHRLWTCPCHKHEQGYIEQTCVGLLQWLLVDGSPYERFKDEIGPLEYSDYLWSFRRMPSFNYFGYRAPDDFEPEFKPAVFASFPIHQVAMVRGGTEQQIETGKAALEGANIPVVEVDF